MFEIEVEFGARSLRGEVLKVERRVLDTSEMRKRLLEYFVVTWYNQGWSD